MKKITVEDYTPLWAHGFQDLSEAYHKHLKGNFKVVHIGGTAIPGMASRPIIDIDIVVDHPGQVIELVSQLTFLGYLNFEDFNQNNVAILKRSIHEVPLLKEHHSKWVDHHLNVCTKDSLLHKSHLIVKEFFLSNGKEVKVFSQLKHALAHKYPKDFETYQKEKYLYFEEILRNSYLDASQVVLLSKIPYL